MSVDDDWDVEQHKVEYESDEHWELRRKFLLAHKDKFAEDMLVCLAQVFVNVELLGCRYPQETMDLMKELSQDVAAEYREKQKKKLQRTFVAASEAASSKVKGCPAKTSVVTEEPIPNILNHISDTANHTKLAHKKRQSKKKMRLVTKIQSFSDATKEPVSSTTSHNCQSRENLDIETSPPKRLKTKEDVSFKHKKHHDHPYRDFVLWEKSGDNVLSILETSAAISSKVLTWNHSKIEEGWECCITINSQKLSSSVSSNRKVAKKEAATIAIKNLRKCCYTVKVKQDPDTNSKVTVTTEGMKSQESLPDDDWKACNGVGNKLMKMMGWSGGGLGKSEQGIMEPMSAMIKTQINREGLGLKTNSPLKAQDIKAKCRHLLKDFLQTDNYLQNDIVFCDFPKEDRVIIHQIARSMGLKSRSHGKDQRKLIVSRKVNIWKLIRELDNLGGITETYELVKPTDEKFISLPTSTYI